MYFTNHFSLSSTEKGSLAILKFFLFYSHEDISVLVFLFCEDFVSVIIYLISVAPAGTCLHNKECLPRA